MSWRIDTQSKSVYWHIQEASTAD